MNALGTDNPPFTVTLVEILRVETGHVLLSWPVGAHPSKATRRWIDKPSGFGPEAVGGQMYVRFP